MTKRNPLPPQEYLLTLFTYEPDTGLLRWNVSRAQMRAGDIAGAKRGELGYLQVSVDRKLYRVHLVIWKMVTGSEPPHHLDHRDTDKQNNRWGNLREANKSQNQANVGLIATNTSGAKNVIWYKAYKKWAVQIWKDGTAYFGGYHETVESASESARALREKLYGEFARAA